MKEANETTMEPVADWPGGQLVVTWIGAALIAGGYALYVGSLLTI
jgi:hypothetical protein